MAELFQHGGWIMVAIAAVSLAAWAVAVWKWQLLAEENADGLKWADHAVVLAARRNRNAARNMCRDRKGCVVCMIRVALMMNEKDRSHFDRFIVPVAEAERLRLRRGLGFVQALGGAAPLLGLLGTVTGMVNTFSSLVEQGTPEIQAMSAGISQALITTQAGLVVGLIVLLVHGHLDARVQRCVDTGILYAKKIETAVLHD